MQGKIIKGIAGFYYIYAENDEIYECKAKGIFRKDKQKPLVGDNVEIEVLDEQEKEGSVTAILPRKNSLIRPAVANVDQAFVIFAMENPKPNFMLLDRFLIMMEKENVPAVICFNKKDLAKQEELELLYETYKSYPHCNRICLFLDSAICSGSCSVLRRLVSYVSPIYRQGHHCY